MMFGYVFNVLSKSLHLCIEQLIGFDTVIAIVEEIVVKPEDVYFTKTYVNFSQVDVFNAVFHFNITDQEFRTCSEVDGF